jgi:hypothetical protein
VTTLAARRPPLRLDLSSGAIVLGLAAGPLLVGALAADANGLRLALTAAATLLLLTLGIASPRALLFALLVWVFALGSTRRIVSLDTPRGALDPLLVVAPIGVAALLLTAVHRDGFRHRTPLSNAVLVLGALIAVSAFNPLQGSMVAGVVGAALLLTPLAGFWIGRALSDATLTTVWKFLGALALVSAGYGLVQILRDFPIWDEVWLREFGYEALAVGEATRPFSTFASSAEHVLFLAIAIVVWLAYGTKRAALPITIPAVAFLATSLFLASTRGAVFAVLLAAGAVLFARLRVPPLLAAAGAAVIVLLVPLTAARLAPASYGSSEVGDLLAHQVEGLADPMNSETSTLGLHLDLARDGFRFALTEPLGLGPGPITNAAMRLGGVGRSTEVDPSNIAVALGFPGLIAYVVVLSLGLARAYKVARVRNDALAFIALGTLAATLFQWFNGGFYLVAFLSWLALGWVDRRTVRGGVA